MFGWTQPMIKMYENTLKVRREQFTSMSYDQMVTLFNTYSASMKRLDAKFDRDKKAGKPIDKFGDSQFAYDYNLLSESMKELEREMPYHRPVQVGMYFNATLHTDTNPYKIVYVSPSGKTAKVRAVETWMPSEYKGTYSQNWAYGDVVGEEIEVRKSKHGWKSRKLTTRYLAPNERPYKHYDYEF
jgi:hypothetical protein